MLKRLTLTLLGAVCVAAVWVAGAGAVQGGSSEFSATFVVPVECGLGSGVVLTMTGTDRQNFDAIGGFHDSVTGTASDTAGNSYVFNYRANIKGDPFVDTGHFTDHFNLTGAGAAGKLQTGFNLVVTINFVKFGERGGAISLGCDPI